MTVVHIANMKMINETLPVYLLGPCGTVYSSLGCLGYLLVLGFGMGLPQGDFDPDVPLTGPNLEA